MLPDIPSKGAGVLGAKARKLFAVKRLVGGPLADLASKEPRFPPGNERVFVRLPVAIRETHDVATIFVRERGLRAGSAESLENHAPPAFGLRLQSIPLL